MILYFFIYRKATSQIIFNNRPHSNEKVTKHDKRYLRRKRNLASQNPIRQLQLGVIYQDNQEGRRKKEIFEVRLYHTLTRSKTLF